MTASDFENTANAVAKQISFTERLGRGDSKTDDGESQEQPTPGATYEPYGYHPTNVGDSCEVTRFMDGTDVAEGINFSYRFLMQIGFVADRTLKLFLPDCVVVIEGKNLGELRRKLARRQCTFIQQWSPKVWPAKPGDAKAVIERISVMRGSAEN